MVDTIIKPFQCLDKIDKLKISYYLTEIFNKCCLLGKTNIKELKLIIDFN